MILEHTFIPCTKTNSKWLKDLKVRQNSIQLLEENIGKSFSDIKLTNVFLGQSPKETEIKAKNKTKQTNKQKTNQTNKLLHSKENH